LATVVTHRPLADWAFPDAPFIFVTDGVASAVGQAGELAGDRVVSVTPGKVGGQAFQAGLVDEVLVGLVPAVFGAGVRYFGDYAGAPLLLDDPEIVQGDRVTHLRYRVRQL
jgi:dihydrofolate reductase